MLPPQAPDGRRFEQQELAAPVVGLAEAARYANAVGLPAIQARNAHLANYLRQQLAQQADLRLLDQGIALSSIVTFEAPGVALADLSAWLTRHQVVHSVSLKPYALLDFTRKQVDGAIRLAPHYFNTLAKLDQTVDVLAAMPRQQFTFQ